MDGQAEDVVVVPQVQPLGVLLPVVHDSNCSDVVDHVSGLRVEQVVPTVVASVTEAQVQEMCSIWINSERTEQEHMDVCKEKPQYLHSHLTSMKEWRPLRACDNFLRGNGHSSF